VCSSTTLINSWVLKLNNVFSAFQKRFMADGHVYVILR